MTSILHASIPGASHFDHTSRHSSSYPDISSLNTSMSYVPRQDAESSFLHTEYDRAYPSSAPSSAPSSPQYTHSTFSSHASYSSTPASSLSLDHGDNDGMDDEEDDEDTFPSYDQYSCSGTPKVDSSHSNARDSSESITPSTEGLPEVPSAMNDDQAVEPEPTRHVDYLSHEWREQDIWSSWRYVVARRKTINNSVRLENASWRTWMKAKNNLKTISPESLNWLKDCDVTWLYGPLQVDTRKSLVDGHSPAPSQLSTSSSFLSKKPILKKKSASAAILERSRSQQSLLQRAGEIIRVQQASPHGRPILRRSGTDFPLPSYTGSSVANTPADQETPSASSTRTFSFPEPTTPSECKHVLFNEEVRQVQAVDSEDDEKDDHVEDIVSESDEDDDGGLMMLPSRTRTSSRSTPRGSFSNENKTIVPLPSTTLKYRTDTPEPQPPPQRSFWTTTAQKLSPSPSQETLRPSRPSHNFLLDDDAEISDEPWQGSSSSYSPYENEREPAHGMRRTPSGMFMPYDENEEEDAMNNTLFGQAVYAINTFKDIAHVVWNVGWNRR